MDKSRGRADRLAGGFRDASYRLEEVAEDAAWSFARLRVQINHWHWLVSQGIAPGFYDGATRVR